MDIIKIKDESIKLGQAMKLAGLVNEGAEAKYAILEGEVKVNGEVCIQRGKKLISGDEFNYRGHTIKITNQK